MRRKDAKREGAHRKRNAVKKVEVGKVIEAPDYVPGWTPVGHAYEGRKRPDGLGQEWC